MGIAAPVIVAEMAEWVALGGGNSGIVGDRNHSYGFHLAASEVGPSDYSRWRDPQGSDGPYVDWSYACAGDFSHRNDERLRAMHRDVLARLMRGELPMICEFIGKPWADRPVYYWARWLGVGTLQLYTGSGHDHWSHISWYRSRANERAYLWRPSSGGGSSKMALGDRTIRQGDEGDDVWELQHLLSVLGYTVPDPAKWGVWERNAATTAAVKAFQQKTWPSAPSEWDGVVGPKTATALKAAVAALPPPQKPESAPAPTPPAATDPAELAAALKPLLLPDLVQAVKDAAREGAAGALDGAKVTGTIDTGR